MLPISISSSTTIVFLMPGMVTWRIRCILEAPSTVAASNSSGLMPAIAAR